MGAFRQWQQREMLKEFEDKYFEVVEKVYRERSAQIATSFSNSLFPYLIDEPSVLRKAEELQAKLSKLQNPASYVNQLVRNLGEKIDDLRRCQKSRKLWEK